jgi:hypothetical protein
VSSPDKLPLALFVAVGGVLLFAHDGEVAGDGGLAQVGHELETLILIRLVQVVEEDAADTASDATVADAEVLVAPLLELVVVAFVVFVAGRLEDAVEHLDIGLVQVVGGQVTAATEPPPKAAGFLLNLRGSIHIVTKHLHFPYKIDTAPSANVLSIIEDCPISLLSNQLFPHLKVSVVEVQRRHVWVPWMDDAADPAGKEGHLLSLGQVLASSVHLRRGLDNFKQELG